MKSSALCGTCAQGKLLVLLFVGLCFTAAVVRAEAEEETDAADVSALVSEAAEFLETGADATDVEAETEAETEAESEGEAEDETEAVSELEIGADSDSDSDVAAQLEGAPKAAPKAAGAAAKGGAPYSADIPLEALSKLPVQPLSMDASALKDDDAQFEAFNAQAKAMDRFDVAKLHSALGKATVLMQKMQRDVEAEKVWTKNVYDIIQNYQYKYLKTIEDVRMRARKVSKMERLVHLLKKSALHAGVEAELAKADKALNELVARAGDSTPAYTRIRRRMTKLKEALREVRRPRQLHSETTQRMRKILRGSIPPASSDALANLIGGAAVARPRPPAKAKAAKAAKAVKGKAAGKGKAVKAAAAGKAAKAKAPAKAKAAPKAKAPAKKAAAPKGKPQPKKKGKF